MHAPAHKAQAPFNRLPDGLGLMCKVRHRHSFLYKESGVIIAYLPQYFTCFVENEHKFDKPAGACYTLFKCG